MEGPGGAWRRPPFYGRGASRSPRPAETAYYAELKAKLDTVLAEVNGLFEKDLSEFNAAVRDAGIPPVSVLPKSEKK